MTCSRCGAKTTAADDLCGRCRLRRLALEARDRRDAACRPDFKARAAGDG